MEALYTRIQELLEYRDGQFYWKVNRSGSRGQGQLAGCLDTNNGYRKITIDGVQYGEHRLVYLMFHGYLPEIIDHIDGNPANNLIENLRECSHTQNMYNQKRAKNNTSGVKGVCWDKASGKWKVTIQIRGNRLFFGYHDDLELAELIVIEAREHYHKEFARHA